EHFPKKIRIFFDPALRLEENSSSTGCNDHRTGKNDDRPDDRSRGNLMSEPIRILAVHAHPVDVEFQCAGTLTLLREAGCMVTIATMTPGDCGSAEHDAEAIAAIRRAEARAS